MADKPINLNKFRKARQKAAEDKTAAENREKFGRTKTDKAFEQAKADEAKRKLDAHKRDAPEE
jgi:hypothetical protein